MTGYPFVVRLEKRFQVGDRPDAVFHQLGLQQFDGRRVVVSQETGDGFLLIGHDGMAEEMRIAEGDRDSSVCHGMFNPRGVAPKFFQTVESPLLGVKDVNKDLVVIDDDPLARRIAVDGHR